MSETIQTKRCPKCKQIKPISEFNKCKRSKDGLNSNCKQCRKQYYQQHKTKILQSCKQYRQKHKAERQQYLQQHKEERQQLHKQYYKTLRGYLRYVWHNMLKRCNNPKNQAYKNYGGRGIKIKFASFDDFYDYIIKELKAEPRGFTIDRINNDGHYERGNIRFVSQAENLNNRRKV